MPIRIHRNTVIANHLIWNGYGSWLSNDPRGRGSTDVRKPELRVLGPARYGRNLRGTTCERSTAQPPHG